MSLRDQVLHGLAWNVASRLGGQSIQFAFSIALARLLSPADFGIVGMLTVLMGFAYVLADGGLNAALIHRQSVTERESSTVFWIQLAIGAALSLAFFLAAPSIAA